MVKQVIQKLHQAFKDSILLLSDEIKKLTPVLHGILRESIHPEIERLDETTMEGKVGTNIEYGPFIEYGVRRWGRTDTKKPATDLVFRVADPAAMFRRGVMIAKPKANIIMRDALKEGLEEIMREEMKNF